MALMGKVKNIAHRGARSLAPENTIQAARKAVGAGADMWELDVAMTSDSELVVLHDDTLERTSNVKEIYPDRAPWKVADFSLDELRKLDFGSWFVTQDPFGQVAARNILTAELERFSGLTIPTLREALEFTRDFRLQVNVEIKDLTGTDGDQDVVERVVALIDSLGMTGSVIISSFNHAYIERVKQANPNLVTAALIETPVDDPLALLQRTGAQALNPDLALVNDDQVKQLRDAGFDVYVWTVNEEADMRRMIKAGVSGIITDFPQLLHRILTEP